MLFDTHAHLQLEPFDGDRDEALERARQAGVVAILNVGFSLETTRAAIALAEREGMCWATAGLHPHDAHDWSPSLGDELRDLARHPKVVAIGEGGLDYYRHLSPRESQFPAFIGQIELARELDLPLVIHNRDATDDVLDTLERYGDGVRCLLHCFGGDERAAERALKIGCHFGIGGPVTYPKNEALREVVRGLPLERIFVETDSPWLAPQFRRGKRNEPAYIRATAETVAALFGMSLETLGQQTTVQATRFFKLPLGHLGDACVAPTGW